MTTFDQDTLLQTRHEHVRRRASSLPVRHTQALVASLLDEGFSLTEIARAAEMEPSNLQKITSKPPSQRIQAATHERVERATAERIRQVCTLTCPQAALAHLRSLAEQAPPTPLADHLGMSRDRLMNLLVSPPRWLDARTAETILEAKAEEIDFGYTVDGDLTRRRIQSLYALGHTQEVIARAAGLGTSTLSLNRRTRKWYAERIRIAYQALSNLPGDSEFVRTYANKEGFLPPLGWDDPETLEWPTDYADLSEECMGEAIDMVAIRRRIQGEADSHLTKQERKVLVQVMTEEGYNSTEVSRALRASGATVKKMIAECQVA